MENYKVIKGYLESFNNPEMKISEVLNNIYTAENEFEQNTLKTISSMEMNIGKCYYYCETDECITEEVITTARYFVRINEVRSLGTGKVVYACEAVEITDDAVYYMDYFTLTESDLCAENIRTLPNEVFEEALSKYHSLTKWNPTF